MGWQKFSTCLLCSLLLTLAVQASEVDPNGQLRFALGGEVSLINPVLSTDSVSSAVEGAIFNGLVKVNAKPGISSGVNFEI